MRTSTIFKSVVAIALFALASSSLFAQVGTRYNTLPATAAEATDTVAVGARMPYYVAPHTATAAAVTAGFLDASVYKWIFKDNTGTALASQPAILQYGSPAATKVTISTIDYYLQNEISVVWSATGSYSIEATERSRPKVGVGCESSTTTSRAVVVQDKPTFAFTATATGACAGGASTSFDLPITLTGSGPWLVSYTVSKDGGAANAFTQTITDGKMPYRSGITALPLKVNLNDGTIFTAAAGTYTVTVTKIEDRITAKALDPLSTTVAANNVFNIGLIAAPTTSPIQHVTNL